MAEQMSFKTMFVSFLIVGIAIIAMINFSYYFAINNNANQTILDDPYFNSTFGDLETELTGTEDKATSVENATVTEIEGLEEGEFTLTSIVNTASDLGDNLKGVYNLTLGLVFRFLGFGYEILGIINTIVIVTIIFMVWRAFKLGY